MKKEKIHLLTMITGLLIAVALIFSHVFISDYNSPTGGKAKTEKAKTEQNEDQKSDTPSFTCATTIAPPSSAHIHTSFLAHCIFEITRSTRVENLNCFSELRPRSEKLLLTLFRVIISPNAP